MTAQPRLITGGKAYPITAAQLDAGRRCRPMGLIAGLDAPRRAAAAAPAAQLVKPDGRALSRVSMLKAIGAKYGEDARKVAEASANPRRNDVDPKLNIVGQPQPPRPSGGDSRALSRASMLREVERIGGAVR